MTAAALQWVGRLQSEGTKTLSFFQGLPVDAWEKEVYSDGAAWKLRQVLAHFIAAEISMGKLIDNIVAGGAGTPVDFDLNGYNEKKVAQLDDLSPEELMARFQEVRASTAERVGALSQTDLEQSGRHPFLGQTTVSEIVKMIYRHNQIHLREIRGRMAEAHKE